MIHSLGIWHFSTRGLWQQLRSSSKLNTIMLFFTFKAVVTVLPVDHKQCECVRNRFLNGYRCCNDKDYAFCVKPHFETMASWLTQRRILWLGTSVVKRGGSDESRMTKYWAETPSFGLTTSGDSSQINWQTPLVKGWVSLPIHSLYFIGLLVV